MKHLFPICVACLQLCCVQPPGWNSGKNNTPVIKDKSTVPPDYKAAIPKLTDTASLVKEPKDNISLKYDHSSAFRINTGKTTPAQVLTFANSLLGVPYLYASTNPSKGFDCSGFITYVFNHFNIAVPRSSIEFTNVGKEIDAEDAKPGDIILFTGTNKSDERVGHMGIITSNINNDLEFIHSSSGKANGVTISPLSGYYEARFVKVIRVFKQND